MGTKDGVAQWLVRLTVNQRYVGSNPTAIANCLVVQRLVRMADNHETKVRFFPRQLR